MSEATAEEDWRSWLRRDGYAVFRNLCPAPLVQAARAAIDQDLATNFDPKRQLEYDQQSYCPALQRAPVLRALLTESGIAAKLEEAVRFDRLAYNVAQIALRRAGNASRPSPLNGVGKPSLCSQPIQPYPERTVTCRARRLPCASH